MRALAGARAMCTRQGAGGTGTRDCNKGAHTGPAVPNRASSRCSSAPAAPPLRDSPRRANCGALMRSSALFSRTPEPTPDAGRRRRRRRRRRRHDRRRRRWRQPSAALRSFACPNLARRDGVHGSSLCCKRRTHRVCGAVPTRGATSSRAAYTYLHHLFRPTAPKACTRHATRHATPRATLGSTSTGRAPEHRA